MNLNKRERLHGWGYCPVTECVSFRPEKQRDLHYILTQHDAPLLARGLGRSYGDASLQPTGVIHTERMDHIIAFNHEQGIVQAQAGVTLAELMEIAIPRGWLPPVVPGTRFVTLGGAFACNVHGKNHFREGEFAEHVLAIRLTLASGETVECTPDVNTDLFWATAGGMGMTGVIEEVTLKLKPIQSASLKTTTYQVDSIQDTVAAFEHYRESSDYMIGWIDHMAKGHDLGRGIFEAASHISVREGGLPQSQFVQPKPRISVPFFMPPAALNRYVMAFYNAQRFKKYSTERKTEIVGFNGFFHPLDSIAHWNRLYGRRGFFQYQCLIPETPDVAKQLHSLLSFIHEHKLFSFLAVLKYHRDGKGFLTFSRRGYSLALDFPNTARVRALLVQLDRWIADRGGRVYLAKDALLSPELFNRMYGQSAADWRNLIRDIDPESRFTSLMSERLRWKVKS